MSDSVTIGRNALADLVASLMEGAYALGRQGPGDRLDGCSVWIDGGALTVCAQGLPWQTMTVEDADFEKGRDLVEAWLGEALTLRLGGMTSADLD